MRGHRLVRGEIRHAPTSPSPYRHRQDAATARPAGPGGQGGRSGRRGVRPRAGARLRRRGRTPDRQPLLPAPR
ncbi:hypothetical protein FNH13_01630 [Ornithinimicrobium ciconiae]|uniref:Uncharacterized protein n=1 Tax=Ornithinimicrobium ciconiae TaxID=2594265 RepID=A0A516G6T6_9MICO|nr:hypothetical protein FNH13_01630 [Ornithinimicrobium ciconiae]